MKIMKFEGATMREALSKVKAELGDDAVIVSTRQIRRGLLGATGCEISAAIDDESDAPPPPSMRSRYGATSPPPPQAPQTSEDVDKIRGELRSLRALVRSSGDNRELRNEVAELRKLVETLRAPPPPPTPPTAPAAFQAAPRSAPPTTPLVAPSRGRIIMLVGPTGAGKTTTIAKLAAQAALIEQRTVGIITLDNYRVGGVDQIRTFAELIGVPLQVVGSIPELGEVLEQDDGHELTLIDTAGRSPLQAAAVIAELAAALPSMPAIEVHLVAPAASTPAMLDELARRHAPLHPTRLLVTKLDEVSGELPDLLAAPGRLGLSITWVTTGQAVPEDLESPTTVRLLDLASGVLNKRAAA